MDKFNPHWIDYIESGYSDPQNNNETEKILKWINDLKSKANFKITNIPLSSLKNWNLCEKDGRIKHTSGAFFSIDGIRIKSKSLFIRDWDQPIINQSEIGLLGFIAKKINNRIHFLVQAKIEPGNLNVIQLSPTIQATKSNYNLVHKGNKPYYLEYFLNASEKNILFDQLLSEQGSRFLKKRNRNMIIYLNDEIEIYENFKWMTVYQIKQLIKLDNTVNMDTRTVLSGIDYLYNSAQLNKNNIAIPKKSFVFKSYSLERKSKFSLDYIIDFIKSYKQKFKMRIDNIHLQDMRNWIVNDQEIYRKDKKFFKIIGIRANIGNREVKTWDQPMIKPLEQSIFGNICKIINGHMHFIVQIKSECGNRDILELGPSVQCAIENNMESLKTPFLKELLNSDKKNRIYDSFQSEEGGRFYQEQNRNILVFVDESFCENLPSGYIWADLKQLYILNKNYNILNIQLRNLLTMISLYD